MALNVLIAREVGTVGCDTQNLNALIGYFPGQVSRCTAGCLDRLVKSRGGCQSRQARHGIGALLQAF